MVKPRERISRPSPEKAATAGRLEKALSEQSIAASTGSSSDNEKPKSGVVTTAVRNRSKSNDSKESKKSNEGGYVKKSVITWSTKDVQVGVKYGVNYDLNRPG
jgi:hypothetical protein